MHHLKNKVALVTGSARGLGKAVALALAKEGCIVVVNYLASKKEAAQTINEIKALSPKSFSIQSDVTKEDDIKNMFKKIYLKAGKVDILVNNVGNFIYKAISDTSIKEWESVIANNLHSVFCCSKYALPLMRKNKYGRIINLGCAGCDRITIRKFTTPYYIAKTGVLMLTKGIAMEEAKHGITVNVISPGIMESSIVKHNVPAGRLAKFDDIVNAILFVLAEESDYINGANIEVSGGWAIGSD